MRIAIASVRVVSSDLNKIVISLNTGYKLVMLAISSVLLINITWAKTIISKEICNSSKYSIFVFFNLDYNT